MANKENNFFPKVVNPYREIQDSIENYKDDLDSLLKVFNQLSGKLQMLLEIRGKALHLNDTIEQLDEVEDGGNLLYLSYIKPELQRVIMELDHIGLTRLESLFDRSSSDFNKLIEYSHRINLRTFI